MSARLCRETRSAECDPDATEGVPPVRPDWYPGAYRQFLADSAEPRGLRSEGENRMEKLIEKASVLVEALPYIQEFRDSVVVVKLGGSVMEDEAQARSVLRDVVFMECAGMRPVVVHGGGKAITAALKAAQIETRFIQGLRYTCERTIGVVDRVLHEENAKLVAMVRELGGKPFAVSGKTVLRAERITAAGPGTGAALDLGFVGRVVNVDSEQIQWVLNRHEVPVVAPLARDMSGQAYNINADMAACQIAAAVRAAKLVFLSDVPGILRDAADPQSLISTITLGEIDGYISRGVISGGMTPKVRSAADALQAGCRKVHMIDGRIRHSLLLEFFTDHGIGTQITP
ncbi:MAG: Acetylglutamate kinase [Lentisphaerae bacterium ADurb.BinA184]|nr:MAG: Acetylglutamate kinase [Lentisphaerae bacterium ADurb.BinA184]